MQLSGALLGLQGRTAPRWVALGRHLVTLERGRPVLFVPVFMGAGDLAYFAARSEPPAWLGAAALLPLVALAMLLRGAPRIRAAAIAAACVALGFAAAQLAAARAPPAAGLPAKAAVISGVVAAAETLPEGRRISIAAARLAPDLPALPRSLRIRLRPDDPASVEAGDSIRVRALVRPPSPPTYPGGWDLQRDAWFEGIAGYGYALNPVEMIAQAPPGGLAGLLQLLRARIAARVEHDVPGAAGAIAATLLTGLAAAIPPADRAAFRDSGLAHLLAIAGLHVGIVMGLVFGLTRFCLALWERAALHLPIRQIAGVAALAAGGGYMALTGMHVPIMRSFAMAALVTLGLLSGRRAVSLRGLCLAAAVLILVAPEQIVGVSFQMSFSAVLALIVGYEAARPWLTRLRGEGGWPRRAALFVVGLGLTSLLAGTASAPFAAYHFGHVQLYFVVANMVAVPLTALWIMPAGLAALALMPLGLALPALAVMGWGIEAVLAIAHAVAAWPAATLAVPHIPDFGLAAIALGMAWLGLWRSILRFGGVPLVVLGLVSPLLVRPPDILVSSDARLIALRTASGIYAQAGPGAAKFTRESWEQYWASGKLLKLEAGQDSGTVRCDAAACELRGRTDAVPAVLLRSGPAPCGPAVVISAQPIRERCPGATAVIDRFTVWRDGAQAIWLDGSGATILSDRADRGDRPWVALGPQQRAAVLLPMAPTEALPEEDR